MDTGTMHLRIMLPHTVLVDCPTVCRIVVETSDGAYGLLPRRLDCTAALVPGILCYETAQDGELFVALDEGVMVKTGMEIRIAVRQAIAGSDLGRLRAAVELEFRAEAAREHTLREALAKLEAGFVRRFLDLQRV